MPTKNKKTSGHYVDGFVLVVPKKNLNMYKEMATEAGKVWKKYGALDFKECVGDDLYPKQVVFPFPKAMKLKKGETVVFSFIVFKSRVHRDSVNAKVMKDPFMNDPKYKDKPMPFDMKRMCYGGFTVLVDA
ncbi:MAG: RNA signal recognition particle [Candidatus Magasanikbacteria bacterium RIFCSPHIGHO2_02_FULL_47_14]|uniref:RNA signal recognition particle n=1 Tax=Candidatus Magasanikbacteria bacterium RIFCSPHIGHO2_02_FULL_47_14 TaxID=1798680 RepID=A0A1F6MAL6_9BACT|nr:MAG: RNA signal recognition particle [Candidatus Magasanikbacteria bacterium RIFCSPHIGHO2_02_FULL_47_14]